jgi:hypothetical protein
VEDGQGHCGNTRCEQVQASETGPQARGSGWLAPDATSGYLRLAVPSCSCSSEKLHSVDFCSTKEHEIWKIENNLFLS